MNPTSPKIWRSVVLTSVAAALGVACSFPEHTFIPDDEFNSGGNSGTGNASSGGASGSSTGGDSGSSSGGSSGSSGQGGAGGTSGSAGSAGVGGATGGTGGAAGASGSAGSSGGTGLEDCTNGVDDDDDNKADCEDPKCQGAGYQCLALPSGWEGPVQLAEGTDLSTLNCGGNYPNIGPRPGTDLNVPNAQCSACTCGTPTGAITCHFPDISLYENNACGAGYRWTFTGADLEMNGVTSGSCFGAQDPFTGPNGELPTAAATTTPPTTGGSCVPGGGAPTKPSTSWNTQARSCAGPTGGNMATGCGTNTCVPPAAGQYNRGVCVYQDGDQACPSGVFSHKYVYYTGTDDTRGCTACSCNEPTGVTCNGARLEVSAGASCKVTPDGTVTTPGTTCAAVASSSEQSFKYIVGTATGGMCPPVGGQPTGTATPTSPITFCCIN